MLQIFSKRERVDWVRTRMFYLCENRFHICIQINGHKNCCAFSFRLESAYFETETKNIYQLTKSVDLQEQAIRIFQSRAFKSQYKTHLHTCTEISYQLCQCRQKRGVPEHTFCNQGEVNTTGFSCYIAVTLYNFNLYTNQKQSCLHFGLIIKGVVQDNARLRMRGTIS